MKNSKFVGSLAAIYSVFVWGTTFVVTKNLMKCFNAAEILFIRFLIAYVLLALAVPFIKDSKPAERKASDELVFIGLGFMGLFFYGVLEIISMDYTYASNTSTIVSTNPFFTALLCMAFLKEDRAGLKFYLGFALAMVGIVMISFTGATEFGLNPFGDFLALGCSVSWSAYTVLLRVADKKGYSNYYITRRTYFWGVIFMLISLPFFGLNTDMTRFADKSVISGLLFLGIIASCTCYLTWNYATNSLGPVKSSIYIYVIPVVTKVFAFLFLDEKMNVTSLAGIIIVIAGTMLSSISKTKKE